MGRRAKWRELYCPNPEPAPPTPDNTRVGGREANLLAFLSEAQAVRVSKRPLLLTKDLQRKFRTASANPKRLHVYRNETEERECPIIKTITALANRELALPPKWFTLEPPFTVWPLIATATSGTSCAT